MVTYSNVKLDKPFTWVKFQEGMCDSCEANCCKIQTDVTLDELIQMGVLDEFYREEPLKNTAKQLKKDGIIKLFNFKKELFTLEQREDGDCILLDMQTRKCTVYAGRPNACKDHPKIGANPGHCAYIKKGTPVCD